MIEKIKTLYEHRYYLWKWVINKPYRIEYCHKTLQDKGFISYFESVEENKKDSKGWRLNEDIIGQLDNLLVGPNISRFSFSENPNGKCYLKIKVAYPEDAMTVKLIFGAGDIEYNLNGDRK